MTDLQLTLIAGGAVAVVAVFSYNKWQEVRARKSVERAFAGNPDDVLMQPRQEPEMDLQPHAVPAQHAPASAQAHTAAEEGGASELASELAPKAKPKPELPIDKLIDCVIKMSMEAPMRAEKLLPVLQHLRHVGNKPVHYCGLRVDGDWEPIVYGGQYAELKVGVQMASRATAMNELEYSELVTRLRQLGDEIGAEADIPDMIDVMARARSLHQFVLEHDAQLGINLASNGAPWAMNTLLLALEKQGFDVRPDGRFVMKDGAGGNLFSLSTNVTVAADTTSRLTLLLDVPCVAPEKDPFGAMTACAHSLAQRLDASIVDDSNQILSDAQLQEIAGQVQAFYIEMQGSQIPAGSTRAQRLFN
ncbi:cell division protein ZipA C-terminal FtsZ-binding domain-containing protein [Massilia sp. W12]|uniref:cell division protein ZipA C-terminal FtsZ-binding domain-containing protein n=1 Tax=Massilia sp. W12 TaxID=3126507 RepID=UPI0030CCFCF0